MPCRRIHRRGRGILRTWKPADARTAACAPQAVHYLSTGGARAAAVLAADAAFAHVLAERTLSLDGLSPEDRDRVTVDLAQQVADVR